jgi:tricorn protease-like protein
MNNSIKNKRLGVVTIAAVAIVAIVIAVAAAITTTSFQNAQAFLLEIDSRTQKAPIAVSGDNNVYVVWFTDKNTPNKNGEVMFKASSDGGKTWSNKTNLSNTHNVDSVNAEINAAGNNVYVTWWERANATSNEPVMRVSSDNGKTFGEIIKLSGNSTAGAAAPIG